MKSREEDWNEDLRVVLAAIDETWDQLNSAIQDGDTTTARHLKKKIEELAAECDRLTEDHAWKGVAD